MTLDSPVLLKHIGGEKKCPNTNRITPITGSSMAILDQLSKEQLNVPPPGLAHIKSSQILPLNSNDDRQTKVVNFSVGAIVSDADTVPQPPVSSTKEESYIPASLAQTQVHNVVRDMHHMKANHREILAQITAHYRALETRSKDHYELIIRDLKSKSLERLQFHKLEYARVVSELRVIQRESEANLSTLERERTERAQDQVSSSETLESQNQELERQYQLERHELEEEHANALALMKHQYEREIERLTTELRNFQDMVVEQRHTSEDTYLRLKVLEKDQMTLMTQHVVKEVLNECLDEIERVHEQEIARVLVDQQTQLKNVRQTLEESRSRHQSLEEQVVELEHQLELEKQTQDTLLLRTKEDHHSNPHDVDSQVDSKTGELENQPQQTSVTVLDLASAEETPPMTSSNASELSIQRETLHRQLQQSQAQIQILELQTQEREQKISQLERTIETLGQSRAESSNPDSKTEMEHFGEIIAQGKQCWAAGDFGGCYQLYYDYGQACLDSDAFSAAAKEKLTHANEESKSVSAKKGALVLRRALDQIVGGTTKALTEPKILPTTTSPNPSSSSTTTSNSNSGKIVSDLKQKVKTLESKTKSDKVKIVQLESALSRAAASGGPSAAQKQKEDEQNRKQWERKLADAEKKNDKMLQDMEKQSKVALSSLTRQVDRTMEENTDLKIQVGTLTEKVEIHT